MSLNHLIKIIYQKQVVELHFSWHKILFKYAEAFLKGKPISFNSCKSTITIKAYQAFSNDLQNRYLELKLFLQNINVKKKIWGECICRNILRNSFFMTRHSSILLFAPVQSVLAHR